MALPNNGGPGSWQYDYFQLQNTYMIQQARPAQCDWHINYDHPREQSLEQPPQQPGVQHDKQAVPEPGHSSAIYWNENANDEHGQSTPEPEDSDVESDADADADDLGFSADLRAFLRPTFGADDSSTSGAVYTLPEGRDVLGSDGEEDGGEDGENEEGGHPKRTGRWAHLKDAPRGKGIGVHRGPRKAAPMTPEIAMRMSLAGEEWQKENHKKAAEIAMDVIRINAETHQAWTLLATIFQENKDMSNAAKCLVYAAHLRPKHIEAWTSAAEYCLTETGPDRTKFLQTALACYGAAIRNKSSNLTARLGQAKVCLLLNKPARAAIAYARALKYTPANRELLLDLAEVCLDAGDAQLAIVEYKKAIAHLRAAPDDADIKFDWNDLATYITLLEEVGQWENAIKEIKSVGRWLNGREAESFWDNVTQNDCEWDTDNSRRAEVPEFVEQNIEMTEYGVKMPIEIRVKLGMNRLLIGDFGESMKHLECLDPLNERGESQVFEYPHLFRQVADAMALKGHHELALAFYQPLRENPDHVDAAMLNTMGHCFVQEGNDSEAIAYLREAADLDPTHIESRMELARLYEKTNEAAHAFNLVNEVMMINRHQHASQKPRKRVSKKTMMKNLEAEAFLTPEFANRRISNSGRRARPESGDEGAPKVGRQPTREQTQASRLRRPRHNVLFEVAIEEARRLQLEYFTMVDNFDEMRSGNLDATSAWVGAATVLTNDFRGFKTFYPWEKYQKFLGYSASTKVQVETPLDKEIKSMSERLSKGLNVDMDGANIASIDIPDAYRGLSFNTWLDIFLELAMCLARLGFPKEAYALCDAAKDCIIWVHSREDMFLIHVAFCMCALLSNDEQTAIEIARWFTKNYQFTSDSYRLVSAVSRVCHSPVSWFTGGPTQKYILREIKTMDWTLADAETKRKYIKGNGGYSAKDEDGHLIKNDDMDINLLMLYGHILFTAASYTLALNYFFRCHALDPKNPVINLMIGLCYISDCLKRQAENRQYSILQGTSFLLVYYESRKISQYLEERQEAHYNLGRAYNMLGLPHLAIPYYQKVLDEIPEGAPRPEREDLVVDAAYNLKTLYATAGNIEMARQITMRWLVI
ncbi:hypothetical protein PZA11_002263 [Diplocarpon coronariae]|uniref:RNA polymerase III transcription factor TFIIIC subunit Tfc n=1 Tax=Diplocarpon coronariae TaxID=2795749 RepID=A0A218YZB0_9HELO|nr:RNA polymerase III transcription factor TFIIIC subunit Tfc [Marssonina coronariae]